MGSTVVPHRYLLLVHSADAQKITPAMLSAIRAEVSKYASSRQYRLVDSIDLNLSADDKIGKGRIRVGSQRLTRLWLGSLFSQSARRSTS